MSEQNSPFTKLHIEEVTPAKRTLLDELNLPPKVTKFIRDNAQTLKTTFIAIIVLSAAWSFYNYYTQKQKNDAATLLAQAMYEVDPEKKPQKLQEVIASFPRSDAALWGKIELAHDGVAKKEYAKAKEELGKILASLDKDSPLSPLVMLDMAQVDELNSDLDSALAQYAKLAEITGFATVGYLGQARVYEQKNENGKAREIYEKLKAQEGLEPSVLEWVEAKLARL
ncbi:MAG: tetratricopeptide repeat protein [Deltaproteobacteria bacterium]|nr:tetratricopeptide repeat protein [Deltaproteobacteria bacterium]